jgi:hypothetical protein
MHITILLSGLILILSCTDCTSINHAVNSRNTVHIAANLLLTGDLAYYGVSVRDGSDMAIDDFDITILVDHQLR